MPGRRAHARRPPSMYTGTKLAVLIHPRCGGAADPPHHSATWAVNSALRGQLPPPGDTPQEFQSGARVAQAAGGGKGVSQSSRSVEVINIVLLTIPGRLDSQPHLAGTKVERGRHPRLFGALLFSPARQLRPHPPARPLPREDTPVGVCPQSFQPGAHRVAPRCPSGGVPAPRIPPLRARRRRRPRQRHPPQPWRRG